MAENRLKHFRIYWITQYGAEAWNVTMLLCRQLYVICLKSQIGMGVCNFTLNRWVQIDFSSHERVVWEIFISFFVLHHIITNVVCLLAPFHTTYILQTHLEWLPETLAFPSNFCNLYEELIENTQTEKCWPDIYSTINKQDRIVHKGTRLEKRCYWDNKKARDFITLTFMSFCIWFETIRWSTIGGHKNEIDMQLVEDNRKLESHLLQAAGMPCFS